MEGQIIGMNVIQKIQNHLIGYKDIRVLKKILQNIFNLKVKY
jgi:hypothetical protein